LSFIGEHNFLVNYTVIPYPGVSMIDFRFELDRPRRLSEILASMEQAFTQGDLKHLYAFDETDRGPEVHQCTSYSSVFVRDKAKLVNNSLYLQAYFDNENSVNRYFDLVNSFANGKTVNKIGRVANTLSL
jgi:glyceraldehyde 3-phosphate dehydrogenase